MSRAANANQGDHFMFTTGYLVFQLILTLVAMLTFLVLFRER